MDGLITIASIVLSSSRDDLEAGCSAQVARRWLTYREDGEDGSFLVGKGRKEYEKDRAGILTSILQMDGESAIFTLQRKRTRRARMGTVRRVKAKAEKRRGESENPE